MEDSENDIVDQYKNLFLLIEKASRQTGKSRKAVSELVFQEFIKEGEVNEEKFLKSLIESNSDNKITGLSNRKFCWLILGETGMGKSSFINQLMEKEVAPENSSEESETNKVEVYIDDYYVLIDTPGLFDTHLKITNSNIMGEVSDKIMQILDVDAQIDAVFLVWNPTAVRKFRFADIKDQIVKTFGENIISSMILLINKDANNWRELHTKLVEDFLGKNNLGFPHIIQDVKNLNVSNLFDTNKLVKIFTDNNFFRHRWLSLIPKFQEALEKRERIKSQENIKKTEEFLEIQLEKIVNGLFSVKMKKELISFRWKELELKREELTNITINEQITERNHVRGLMAELEMNADIERERIRIKGQSILNSITGGF